MKKKTILIMLVLVLIFSATAGAYACEYHGIWYVEDFDRGSVESDVTSALGIASLLSAGVGFGGSSLFMAAAAVIADGTGGWWTAYYEKHTFFSPDSYAYMYRVIWYENSNYTSMIDEPICSPVYYITAAPAV